MVVTWRRQPPNRCDADSWLAPITVGFSVYGGETATPSRAIATLAWGSSLHDDGQVHRGMDAARNLVGSGRIERHIFCRVAWIDGEAWTLKRLRPLRCSSTGAVRT